jgi:hypothetical protein
LRGGAKIYFWGVKLFFFPPKFFSLPPSKNKKIENVPNCDGAAAAAVAAAQNYFLRGSI